MRRRGESGLVPGSALPNIVSERPRIAAGMCECKNGDVLVYSARAWILATSITVLCALLFGATPQILETPLSLVEFEVAGAWVTAQDGLIVAAAIGVFAGESVVYRTVGMMDSALADIDKSSDDAAKQIRHAIEGNICRCTGYHNIVAAVRAAAVAMREGTSAPAAVTA